jgi:hypothetical protein
MKDILTAIITSAILISPALAEGSYGGYHAAPGPIAGAGLPFLAVGFGVYWLVRRSRRKPD